MPQRTIKSTLPTPATMSPRVVSKTGVPPTTPSPAWRRTRVLVRTHIQLESLRRYALCVHSFFRCQPFMQLRPAPPARDVSDSNGDGLLLTDQNDQLLAPGEAGRADSAAAWHNAGS